MSIAETMGFIAENPIAREIAGEAAKSTAQGAALHWGARLGSRLIPGVGEVLLVYDAVSLAHYGLDAGFKLATGREWKDTAVGGAVDKTLEKINGAAATASGYVVEGASSLLNTVGFSGAGQKVASWGKYLLCGDNGKPVSNDAIARNPILRRGDQKIATAADLPTPTASGVSVGDLQRIANLKNHVPAREAEINTAVLSRIAGSPTAIPDRDLAARDQERLQKNLPSSETAGIDDRLKIFSLASEKSAAAPASRRISAAIEM